MPVNGTSAAMFLESQGVSKQAKYGYSKTISAALRTLGAADGLMPIYQRALCAAGALVPLRQAVPMPKPFLFKLLQSEDAIRTPLLWLLWALAWKGASRLAEILRLTKAAFTHVDDNNTIIAWGHDTKGTRINPWAEYMLTWIAGDLAKEIIRRVRAAPEGRLFPWKSTNEIQKFLPRPYTCHSFKHGAASVLVNAVADGQLTEVVMMRLLKHKGVTTVAETTLRYVAGDKVATARMLKTADATRLL